MSELGPSGRALVGALAAELGDEHEYDARESELIDLAARLADRLAALEDMIAADGLRLVSATGVVKVHPAASEHRQTAIALAKVLDTVKLPDEAASGSSPRSVRKSRAAHRRWENERRRREAREGWSGGAA